MSIHENKRELHYLQEDKEATWIIHKTTFIHKENVSVRVPPPGPMQLPQCHVILCNPPTPSLGWGCSEGTST